MQAMEGELPQRPQSLAQWFRELARRRNETGDARERVDAGADEMSHRKITLIERIIWTWECCGERSEYTQRPARERRCPECKRWVAFEKETYTGPEIGAHEPL